MAAYGVSALATVLLALLATGCSARCCCPEPEVSKQPVSPETAEQRDRYVVVVHGLGMEDTLAIGKLIADLGATLPAMSTLSIDILVPRSHAREAYLRILRTPYRDRGLLVEWSD